MNFFSLYFTYTIGIIYFQEKEPDAKAVEVMIIMNRLESSSLLFLQINFKPLLYIIQEFFSYNTIAYRCQLEKRGQVSRFKITETGR